MELMRIEHLTKVYGSGENAVHAVDDVSFSVEKGERDGRTYTRVVLLDREQRKAELARITGGSHVTEALLASAGELLDQAERYRGELGMRNHAE